MNPEEMEDDEALQAAIRASMAEHKEPQGHAKQFIDLTNESDKDSDVQEVFPKSNAFIGPDTDDEADEDIDDQSDEDLKRAIALSLLQQPKDESKPPAAPVLSEKPNSMGIAGLAGFDRKQMEAERLARQAKRKAEDPLSPSAGTSSKAMKIEKRLDGNSSERSSPLDRPETSSVPTTNATHPTAKPGIQWPKGVVKKTYVAKAQRMGNDITIEEVIQRATLKFGMFSSFIWDPEWLYQKVDMTSTRLGFVMGEKSESEKRLLREQILRIPNAQLFFTPMEGNVNCMHSKLMLLFHTEYLRIVVPTANLTPHDWGESGFMENTVFLIDLPVKSEDSCHPTTHFYQSLVEFLKASQVSERLIAKVGTYDFTETEKYAFVHSIGGITSGSIDGSNNEEKWRETGYCGLGRAVSQLKLGSSSPVNIDYVTSSVGSLNEEYLRAIYLACKGDDGITEYIIRTEKNSRATGKSMTAEAMQKASREWENRFLVYFPSDTTVHAAHPNPHNTAGTICFQKKWWSGPKFPRQIMKDCESKRGVLMHNKLLYVWPDEPIALENNLECKGWAYVGSANLSESAWGRLTKDRTTARLKINCRNWECGVLVPVITSASEDVSVSVQSSSREHRTSRHQDSLPDQLFNDTIPVPMKIPPASLSETRPPWFFMGT